MYIVATDLTANFNPTAINVVFSVLSPVANTAAEAFLDADATVPDMNATIAEAARQACRAAGQDVDNGAPVTIIGGIAQVN
jgi:hypothetical protein